ncbi:MAG: group 1 truncated hemoglobin [Rubrivivax sp.]|nr:group 1 truncated hemoglobin [Rubrivivax sp.]
MFMKPCLQSLAAACVLASLSTAALPQAAPVAVPDDTLYRALGARPGLERLMDDFTQRLQTEARMRPFFKDLNRIELKDKLVVQLCELAGGPCKREGPGMLKVHSGVDIARKDFNAMVDVLQDSMDMQQIPFRTQTRLLALLAAMHREIVNLP